MKRRAIALTVAAVLAFPVVADVTNLSLSGTAYGWHSSGEQSGPGGVNDGSSSWNGNYYGSTTASGVDGHYYILWQDVQTVKSIRWSTWMEAQNRGLSSFTLWALKDGANPDDENAWTKLVDYGDFDDPANLMTYCTVALPQAVSTKAIKLSYTNQTAPLTGEFEIFSRDITPLPIASYTASQALHGVIDAAFDGNVFTSYGSGGLNNGPGFMEVDLGDEQAVGGLHIYFRVQGDFYAAPSAFTLTAWDSDANDGEGGWCSDPFERVTDWGAMDEMFSLNLPEGFSTQKIRLDVTPREKPNVTGGSFGIMEWFLYAPVVPEPATMTLLTLGSLSLLRRRP